ncbi:hypothetical protein [Thermocoleostomius sinensis]|uniref:Uncharacterized protein n=1 Tax=Thermocoleostomius sinensis A174 TaxID=2016057 RepID=A0A9E8ZB86_9CYAN|nr:hypothetical protein [Thermocoleostomius sinensis]WAL60024.1 hypothetical protein OXH18_23100 [Thermocoleostomius sinensis A174]
MATLKSISPSSTVGDLQQARDQVRTTFNDVKQSAQTVQEAKVTELEQTYQDLDRAVSAVPKTATLAQARDSISPPSRSRRSGPIPVGLSPQLPIVF